MVSLHPKYQLPYRVRERFTHTYVTQRTKLPQREDVGRALTLQEEARILTMARPGKRNTDTKSPVIYAAIVLGLNTAMSDDILDALETEQRWRANPLAVHIRPFAIRLIEEGYAKNTIQMKLWSLADFGRWLRGRGFTVSSIDETVIGTFINGRKEERPGRGDLKNPNPTFG